MKKLVILRADGNNEIGFGHVIRSLALADILKFEFECVFATRFIGEFIENEINNICHSSIILDKDSHLGEFLDLLNGDEIVVLDNYFFTSDYQKEIKNKGCKLVCIDDLHDKEFHADLIINHSPTAKEIFYKNSPEAKLALGLKYVLLREAFLHKIYKIKEITKLESVFICFGGSDILQLSVKCIKALLEFRKYKEFNIVTGNNFGGNTELNEICERDTRVKHFFSLTDKEMVSILEKSDVAIVSASSVLFEVFSVGIPVVTGYYVDNQKEAAAGCHDSKLAINAGDLRISFENKILEAIGKLDIKQANILVNNQKKALGNSKENHIKNFKLL